MLSWSDNSLGVLQKDGKPRKEDVFAAPPLQQIKAAKGQLLSWQLTLRNRSRLPVTAARVIAIVPDLSERQQAKATCVEFSAYRCELVCWHVQSACCSCIFLNNIDVSSTADLCRLTRAEGGSSGQNSVGGMRVQIDNAALAAALPLAPMDRVTIPIMLHAAQARLCPNVANARVQS